MERRWEQGSAASWIKEWDGTSRREGGKQREGMWEAVVGRLFSTRP